MRTIELIEWVDSSTRGSTVWKSKELYPMELAPIYTVGFVINETEESLLVAGSDDMEDCIAGEMKIPKCSITNRRELMPSKTKKQAKFMKAVAKSSKFAVRVGVSQKVGKEFEKADKRKKK